MNMRIAIVSSQNIVTNVAELPDGTVIANDSASAAVPGFDEYIQNGQKTETQITATFSIEDSILVQSDDASMGWTYQNGSLLPPA